MSRNIKLKAWDSDRQVFHTDPKWVEFVFINGVITARNFNRKGGIQSLKVIEYTGLKDKNGKEICEGDIVGYTNVSRGRQLDQVVWLDDVACFNVMSPFINLYSSEDITVEGNIYQNPELLEANNE